MCEIKAGFLRLSDDECYGHLNFVHLAMLVVYWGKKVSTGILRGLIVARDSLALLSTTELKFSVHHTKD